MKFKIRKFRKGDEESLRKNINDKEIYKNTLTVPHPYKKKDAKNWVKHNIKLDKIKNPNEINFVVDINGQVAGSIGFIKIDRKNNNAEVSYWLAKRYWNKGIMTNAVKKAVRFGFEKLKLVRVYAFTFVFNRASQKVLKKAGFQFEGKLIKNVKKKGKYYDDLLFAKIK